jgi:hypothetical protein
MLKDNLLSDQIKFNQIIDDGEKKPMVSFSSDFNPDKQPERELS